MKELTTANVNDVFLKCLFQEGEDTSDPALADGVLNKFGFHKGRLEEHRAAIGEMLMQLPSEFHVDKGGGWSFLNACMTADGVHWAEHPTIEQLLALGIATKQARYLMPREHWKILHGGMPYFSVGTLPETKPNSDETWLREKAKIEDASTATSVGGLVEEVKKAESQ